MTTNKFTYEKWLEGVEETKDFWSNLLKNTDFQSSRDFLKIYEAKRLAFQSLVNIHSLVLDIRVISTLSTLDKEEEKLEYLFEKLKTQEEFLKDFDNLKLFEGPEFFDLIFINGPFYSKITNHKDGIPKDEEFWNFDSRFFLGKATKKHNSFLLEQIEELSPKSSPTENLSFEGVTILSHKITLLYELGILDLINERFKESAKNNATQKAKLLSIILGTTDKTTIESIRKLLSYIETQGHKQNPINSESIISVEQILLEFGLTKKRI